MPRPTWKAASRKSTSAIKTSSLETVKAGIGATPFGMEDVAQESSQAGPMSVNSECLRALPAGRGPGARCCLAAGLGTHPTRYPAAWQ